MDIRDAMEIVEEGRASPVAVLYHCTDFGRIESIKTNGLSPSSSRAPVHYPRAVYLSQDLSDAGSFAAKIHPERKAAGYVILRVKVSDLDPTLLSPDDADLETILGERGKRRAWTEVGWRESLRLCGQCTYRGWIKAAAIEVLAAMTVGGRWTRIEQPLAAWTVPQPPNT
jgi:hypothetical protein